jgi:CubicO group peptidase (beta-lactamase class C family)
MRFVTPRISMNRALVAALTTILAITGPVGAAAAAAPTDAELADFARAALDEAYPSDGPGAAVLVRRQGRTVLRAGFGLASLDLAVPIDPAHVFEIGSVTKQFTAAAILRLSEEGKLALSDPITKLLPSLPAAYQSITLNHLLSHTSGVPSYTDFPEWRPRWREDMSLETLIGLFRDKPLDFVPGQSWKYSNSGYILLGAAIEKAAGKSYEDYVEQELFAPLGMADTRYGHQEEVVAGRAVGYTKGPDGWSNAPYLSLTQPYAAGSLMSTVDDLARWSDALEAGSAVSARSRDLMFTPAVLVGGEHDGISTRYGLGNAVGSVGGHATHEHGGGIHGYVCDLLRVPDADLVVVVLSNNPTVHPVRLARRIAEHALGGLPPAAPTIVLDAASLEAYAGIYRMAVAGAEALDLRWVVTRDGDALQLQNTGGQPNTLRPLGEDRFATDDGTIRARFLRDSDGKVDAVEVDLGTGPVLPARRMVLTRPTLNGAPGV